MLETEIMEESNAGVAESREWFLLRKECWVPLAIFIVLAFFNLRSEKWPNEITQDTQEIHCISLIYFGIIYSQPLLCLFWSVWAPHPLRWRIPTAISSFYILCCFLFANEFPFIFHAYAGTYLIPFVAVVLLTLRYIGKLRTHLYTEDPDPTTNNSNKKTQHQFSIKYLLIWTTLISTLLMIGRIMLSEQTSNDLIRFYRLDQILIYATPGISYCFLQILATLTLVLPLTNLKWWKTVVLIGITLPLCAYLAAITIAMQSFNFDPMEKIVSETGWMAIGTIISTGLSALALRWAGYRLVRGRAAPAS